MTYYARGNVQHTRTGASSRLLALDPVLLLAALALIAYGIFAVHIAGSDDSQNYAFNQVIGFVLGLMGAVPLALIDYRVLQRYLKHIYIVAIVILLAVMFFGFVAGGAQSWIDVGPVQVQPSEFAKVLMIVVLAGYMLEHPVNQNKNFLKALALIAAPTLLVFIQPDLGTALVFGAIFVTMAYIAGAKLVQIGALAAAGALSTFLAIKVGILADYQIARLTAFLDQSAGNDIGYQVAQSKMAIGSGGLTGKGLDATTLANLGFLPENHTDFIFSNLAERLGFAGAILLIFLFFVLTWRILHIATVSRDRFGVLLAVGVGTMFLFHVFVNIGMTMGIMPVTGIPLPFISYGRSSLVVSVIALGILQSIAIRSRVEYGKHPNPA